MYYQKNYLQLFLLGQIQAILSEIHIDDGVYFRKDQPLDMHHQIHCNANVKKMITLEGVELCPTLWWTIYGVSRATFYQYKDMTKASIWVELYSNLITKKP